MESQFNSPTSSTAAKKEKDQNKWSAEFVDNSPEFNPISYDFLPQRGSPKGDETPVAKKKRTSLRTLGSSPITTNAQQRLLPPPPSERLEDLKKFTNLYKELLSGNGDDETDEQSESDDLLTDMLNAAESIENNLTNQSDDCSLIRRAPDRVLATRTNSLVNNGVTASEVEKNCCLVRFDESQNVGRTTSRRAERVNSSRTNSQISNINNNRSSISKPRENSRLVRSGADRRARQETPKPKLEETLDLVPNEISLLNDGNDDGFTSIDDTTLSYLCSGSQLTTTSTQFQNTQSNNCRMDYSRTSASNNNMPAECSSKVSAPSSSAVKVSAPNKCLTNVSVPNKCSAQEIERKRREAIKRLLERRRINSQVHSQKVS